VAEEAVVAAVVMADVEVVEDLAAIAVEEDFPVVAADSALEVVASQVVGIMVEAPVVEVDSLVVVVDTPVVVVDTPVVVVDTPVVVVDTPVVEEDSQVVEDMVVTQVVEAVFLVDCPVVFPVAEDIQAEVDLAVEVDMEDSPVVGEDVEVVDVEAVASPVATVAEVAVLAGESKQLIRNRVANLTTKFPKLSAMKT